MKSYRYLIVGGGMTADAAVRGIRSVDEDGSVGLVSAERHPPYDRPPLSKGLWAGQDEERIWRGTDDAGAELHLGRRVVGLDPAARTVSDDRGTTYRYEKLLLATGCAPRRLEGAPEGVIHFRSYDDYRALRRESERGRRIGVVGGGFIGTELAAALASRGKDVVLLFPEEGPLRSLLPLEHALDVGAFFEERGVDVRAGRWVKEIEEREGGYTVRAEDAGGRGTEEIRCDAVVAGLGVVPRTELAAEAGLEVEDGIVVDANLRTRDPAIWSAGDVASFPSPHLDRRLRVEHEDHANASGLAAGRGMAGESEEYTHLPFFYSDLFDLGYRAVGVIDPSMERVEAWEEPYRRGEVYHRDEEGRVRGVLLWGVRRGIREARRLISEGVRRSPGELRSLIENP